MLGFFVHNYGNTLSFRPAQMLAANGEWTPVPRTIIRATDYELILSDCLIASSEQKQIIEPWYTTWKTQQEQKKSALFTRPSQAQINKTILDQVFEQMKILCATEQASYPLNEWQQDMVQELIYSAWYYLKNNTSSEDYQTALREIINGTVSEDKPHTSNAKSLLLYVAAPAINLLGDGKFYAGAENGAELVTIAHVYRFMIKALAIECGDDPTISEIGLPFKPPKSNTEIQKIGMLSGEKIQLIGSDLTPEGQKHYEILRALIYSYDPPNPYNLHLPSTLRRMSSNNLKKLLGIIQDIIDRNYAHDNEADNISSYLCATYPEMDIAGALNGWIQELETWLSKKNIAFVRAYWEDAKHNLDIEQLIITFEYAFALLPEHPEIMYSIFVILFAEHHLYIEALIQYYNTNTITIDTLTTMIFSVCQSDHLHMLPTTLNIVGIYIDCFKQTSISSDRNIINIIEKDLQKLDVIFDVTPLCIQQLEQDQSNKTTIIWTGMKHLLWFTRIKSTRTVTNNQEIKNQLACNPQKIEQAMQALYNMDLKPMHLSTFIRWLEKSPQIAKQAQALIAKKPYQSTIQNDLLTLLPDMQTYAETLSFLDDELLEDFIELTVPPEKSSTSVFPRYLLPYLRDMQDFAKILNYLDDEMPTILQRLHKHTFFHQSCISINKVDIFISLSEKNRKVMMGFLEEQSEWQNYIMPGLFNKPPLNALSNKWSDYFTNIWHLGKHTPTLYTQSSSCKEIGKVLRFLSLEELQQFKILPDLLKKVSATPIYLCIILFSLDQDQRKVLLSVLQNAQYPTKTCITILDDLSHKKTIADWNNSPPTWLQTFAHTDFLVLECFFDLCDDVQIQTIAHFIGKTGWINLLFSEIRDFDFPDENSMSRYISLAIIPYVRYCYNTIVIHITFYKSFVQEAETHSPAFERHNYQRFMPQEGLHDSSFEYTKQTIINMLNEYHQPPAGWTLSNCASCKNRDIFSKKLAEQLVEHIKPITNPPEMQDAITQFLVLLSGYTYHKKNLLPSPLYQRLLYAVKIISEISDAPSLTETLRLQR